VVEGSRGLRFGCLVYGTGLGAPDLLRCAWLDGSRVRWKLLKCIVRTKRRFNMLLLIIILLLLFGGGGGYYGYSRWGRGGGIGIGGAVLLIVVLSYLSGGLRL
jgi:hypothetical protein